MALRAKDWYSQAERDLQHARHSVENKEYEWACFAAQQAAEKALKAAYQQQRAEAWGHSVLGLLEKLPGPVQADDALKDAGRGLDKHYIPARYPNSYAAGAPRDYYTEAEANAAIAQAERILEFCKSLLAEF